MSATWDEVINEPEQDAKTTLTNLPSQSDPSLRSFWFGVMGVFLLTLATIQVGPVISFLLETPLIQQLTASNTNFWLWFYTAQSFLFFDLLPLSVVTSLISILYWRGGLLVRFALVLSIGIVMLNLSHFPARIFKMSPFYWLYVFQIAVCWIAIPLICIYTPMKTVWLRILVSSMLAALAICLSILALVDAPGRGIIVYWLGLLSSAFGFSMARRNWGKTAVVEYGKSAADVERTSTRTLLELMIVASFICIATAFWAGTRSSEFAITIVISVLGGILAAIIGASFCRLILAPRIHWFRLLWIWGLILFHLTAVLLMVLATQMSNFLSIINQASSNPIYFWLWGILVLVSSFVLLGHLVLCGLWLRWMGWRTTYLR